MQKRLVGVLLLLSSQAIAEGGHISTAESDTNPWHITAGIEIPTYNFKIEGKDSGSKLQFDPSTRANLAFSVSHARYITLGAGFSLDQTTEERIKKGSSDYTDLRVSAIKRAWMLRANFSEFKGFYVEKSGAVDPSWTSNQPFIRYPELFSRSTGANLTIAIRPKRYSLRAIHSQEERQIKSGGSLLVGAQVRRETFVQNTAIIPSTVQSSYGSDAGATSLRFSSLIAKAGFGYQYNFSESFFFAGQFLAGLGLVRTQVTGPSLGYSQTRPATKIDGDLALLYNGKSNYGGVTVAADSSSYDTKSLKVDSTLFLAKLFYGRRF